MLLYLHYKEISVLEVGKGEEIQNQGQKDGSRYKIYTSKESRKRNRAGSKAGFFCLTVVSQAKGFWKYDLVMKLSKSTLCNRHNNKYILYK